MKQNWLYLTADDLLRDYIKKGDSSFWSKSGICDQGLLLSGLGQAELDLFGQLINKEAREIAAVYVYHIIN